MRFKNFKNLFVLDLANNHFGDYNHAKKIIDIFSKIILINKIYATIKFQFRDLDTYIHPDDKYLNNNKYITRFKSTRFSTKNFKDLFFLIKKKGILTSCTPFDEKSVSLIEDLNFDIIKIASVSSNDFSILERVSKNKIPKIISTGGLDLTEIDKIVSFMKHKGQNFSLMHCISIYPTKDNDFHLQFIKNLKARYRDVEIGWSTHEDPSNFLPSTLAYAYGASIFERHIGINNKKYKLNNYSSTPEVYQKWLDNFKKIKQISGNYIKTITNEEKNSLSLLSRGVYANKNLKKNSEINLKDISFLFPVQKRQILSSNFTDGIILKKNIRINEPIFFNDVSFKKKDKTFLLKQSIHKVKALLNYANIKLGADFDMEISHHYGMNKFKKFGAFLFNIVNKKYCKKIIVLLPKQKHPKQFHKIKEETFTIVYGRLYCIIDNKKYLLSIGDTIHIKPGIWHEFWSDREGCVFEEISTTSLPNDSFYFDPVINKKTVNERKTSVTNWGRWELKA